MLKLRGWSGAATGGSGVGICAAGGDRGVWRGLRGGNAEDSCGREHDSLGSELGGRNSVAIAQCGSGSGAALHGSLRLLHPALCRTASRDPVSAREEVAGTCFRGAPADQRPTQSDIRRMAQQLGLCKSYFVAWMCIMPYVEGKGRSQGRLQQLDLQLRRATFLVTNADTECLLLWFAGVSKAVQPELMRFVHEMTPGGRILLISGSDARLFRHDQAI